MHSRFTDLYDRIVAVEGDAAHVFVPVGPEKTDPPPILFVGQATRGWSCPELESYDASWRRAAGYVAAPLARSGFFQVIREITSGVGEAIGRPDAYASLQDTTGWSNLVKVGHPKRNPGPESRRLQADLCIRQLNHEIGSGLFAAVVVMTRDFAAEEILLPLFGRDDWENDLPTQDRVAWKQEGLPVIWMNHPRRMGPTGYRRASIDRAIDVVGRRLAHVDQSRGARGGRSAAPP